MGNITFNSSKQSLLHCSTIALVQPYSPGRECSMTHLLQLLLTSCTPQPCSPCTSLTVRCRSPGRCRDREARPRSVTPRQPRRPSLTWRCSVVSSAVKVAVLTRLSKLCASLSSPSSVTPVLPRSRALSRVREHSWLRPGSGGAQIVKRSSVRNHFLLQA